MLCIVCTVCMRWWARSIIRRRRNGGNRWIRAYLIHSSISWDLIYLLRCQGRSAIAQSCCPQPLSNTRMVRKRVTSGVGDLLLWSCNLCKFVFISLQTPSTHFLYSTGCACMSFIIPKNTPSNKITNRYSYSNIIFAKVSSYFYGRI